MQSHPDAEPGGDPPASIPHTVPTTSVTGACTGPACPCQGNRDGNQYVHRLASSPKAMAGVMGRDGKAAQGIGGAFVCSPSNAWCAVPSSAPHRPLQSCAGVRACHKY